MDAVWTLVLTMVRSQLQMVFGGAVPPCPPRMFDLRFPDSVEKARVDLSMWLMQLLQHPPIYTSHVFVDFVSADANVRGWPRTNGVDELRTS